MIKSFSDKLAEKINFAKKLIFSKFTIYQYMIFFLVVLHLASAFFYGFGAGSLIPVFIAVITAVSLDLIIEYLKFKKSRIPNSAFFNQFFPSSALISGLFIGGLLAQGLKLYVYAIAAALAILSKHAIIVRQKHVFNPANFGILLVSVIFRVSHTWWVSSPQILVLLFGIFIIWRLKRIYLALSFLIVYYTANSAIELLKGSGISEIYYTIANGGVVYFFAMFMLIEPKTNPSARKQRIIYGALVAALFIVFQFYIPEHGLPLALAVGNIFVPALNWVKERFINRH